LSLKPLLTRLIESIVPRKYVDKNHETIGTSPIILACAVWRYTIAPINHNFLATVLLVISIFTEIMLFVSADSVIATRRNYDCSNHTITINCHDFNSSFDEHFADLLFMFVNLFNSCLTQSTSTVSKQKRTRNTHTRFFKQFVVHMNLSLKTKKKRLDVSSKSLYTYINIIYLNFFFFIVSWFRGLDLGRRAKTNYNPRRAFIVPTICITWFYLYTIPTYQLRYTYTYIYIYYVHIVRYTIIYDETITLQSFNCVCRAP